MATNRLFHLALLFSLFVLYGFKSFGSETFLERGEPYYLQEFKQRYFNEYPDHDIMKSDFSKIVLASYDPNENFLIENFDDDPDTVRDFNRFARECFAEEEHKMDKNYICSDPTGNIKFYFYLVTKGGNYEDFREEAQTKGVTKNIHYISFDLDDDTKDKYSIYLAHSSYPEYFLSNLFSSNYWKIYGNAVYYSPSGRYPEVKLTVQYNSDQKDNEVLEYSVDDVSFLSDRFFVKYTKGYHTGPRDDDHPGIHLKIENLDDRLKVIYLFNRIIENNQNDVLSDSFNEIIEKKKVFANIVDVYLSGSEQAEVNANKIKTGLDVFDNFKSLSIEFKLPSDLMSSLFSEKSLSYQTVNFPHLSQIN